MTFKFIFFIRDVGYGEGYSLHGSISSSMNKTKESCHTRKAESNATQ